MKNSSKNLARMALPAPLPTQRRTLQPMIVWAPLPHGQAWRCGMVRLPAGDYLTPDHHVMLVKWRVQELADREGSRVARRVVTDLAVDVVGAILPSAPRLDEMGDALVEGLMPYLRARGALITKSVTIAAQTNATQEDWDEMTFETWVASSS